MALHSNWKFLMFVHIITFGLWGFILKTISNKLDWKTIMAYVWLPIFVILCGVVFRKAHLGWNKFYGLAVLAGILAAIGTITFYKALSIAPLSKVIPFSAQYILVAALLSLIFLREPVTLRIITGILSGIAAIILLAK